MIQVFAGKKKEREREREKIVCLMLIVETADDEQKKVSGTSDDGLELNA